MQYTGNYSAVKLSAKKKSSAERQVVSSEWSESDEAVTGVQQPAVVHEEQYDQQMQQHEQRRNVNHLTAHDVTLTTHRIIRDRTVNVLVAKTAEKAEKLKKL